MQYLGRTLFMFIQQQSMSNRVVMLQQTDVIASLPRQKTCSISHSSNTNTIHIYQEMCGQGPHTYMDRHCGLPKITCSLQAAQYYFLSVSIKSYLNIIWEAGRCYQRLFYCPLFTTCIRKQTYIQYILCHKPLQTWVINLLKQLEQLQKTFISLELKNIHVLLHIADIARCGDRIIN